MVSSEMDFEDLDNKKKYVINKAFQSSLRCPVLQRSVIGESLP